LNILILVQLFLTVRGKMIRRDQFKSENQCRADGCNGEVFAKVSQGGDAGLDRRQAGSRSPLSPVSGGYPPNQQMRTFPEGSRILSSFCKKRRFPGSRLDRGLVRSGAD
jgi:hypothetical protein